MLSYIIYGFCLIVAWELYKAVKREFIKQRELQRGLRWECSECATKFASNDKAILNRWVLDHVRAHIESHNAEEARDEEG